MSNLPHKLTLVLGDWSDDGHGKTDVVVIATNLDSDQFMEAYKKASKKLGFHFMDDVAADYEDRSLPTEYLQKLIDNGMELKEVFDSYEMKEAKAALKDPTAEKVSLWAESYTAILLFIVKLGNPEFEYKFVEDGSRINVGGYGLFE